MKTLSRALLNILAIANGIACSHSITEHRQPKWHGAERHSLTRAEMEQAGFATTFDAIQMLRSWELPASAPSATAQVIPAAAVFIDASARDVGLVSLHQLPVAGVCRVLFLHGADARLRYGVERAIVIQTVTRQNCE